MNTTNTALASTNEKFLIPAGTYPARCYSLIHIGTVTGFYKEKPQQYYKISITWELPTELHIFNEKKGPQPCIISRELTLSMYTESHLRQLLESWRGKALTADEAENFELTSILGKPCMLTVVHNTGKDGRTYANFGSISKLSKDLTCPPQVNPTFEFSLNPFDRDKYNSLPEWLRNKISVTREYKEASAAPVFQPLTNSEEFDDVPF